jgi:hypothetical protein
MRLIGNVVVKEVVAPQVQAPVRKPRLRLWVKVVLVLGLVTSVVGVLDACTVSQQELASKVTWVDAYAHDGDGYERMVRNANGTKDMDIKDMSSIMQDKNHGVDIKAGVVYKVPVLEVK